MDISNELRTFLLSLVVHSVQLNFNNLQYHLDHLLYTVYNADQGGFAVDHQVGELR